ncbi:basic helix-loop-helix protein A-like [Humulus lupulus]|uniref:basic helix-loop-helix protein A-like n=1 Tax=Humulus lupulus TaxID=3486 RepID=UPI002B40B863|nr:basic helix-loop-helix protein A-like [Humulus lupulus]
MENEGKRKIKEEEPNKEEEEEEISKLVLGIMEGYSDSVIPPLSQFKPSSVLESAIVVAQEDSSSRKRARTKSIPERDRRVKLNESYEFLESLVPGLLPKASKEKVLHAATEYIKYLEEKKKMLEKLKESSSCSSSEPMAEKGKQILPCTSSSRNLSVSVTFSGNIAFFGIQSLKRQGLVTQIFMVFHKHLVEVLTANVVVNHTHLTLTVTAFVNGNESNTVEEIKRDILIL